MKALGSSPLVGCGTPMTAASRTEGCWRSTPSNSAGGTWKPFTWNQLLLLKFINGGKVI